MLWLVRLSLWMPPALPHPVSSSGNRRPAHCSLRPPSRLPLPLTLIDAPSTSITQPQLQWITQSPAYHRIWLVYVHTDSQNRSRRDPNGALAEWDQAQNTSCHKCCTQSQSPWAMYRGKMLGILGEGCWRWSCQERVNGWGLKRGLWMRWERIIMIVLSGCDGGRRLGESRLEKNPLWRPLTRAAERRRRRSIRAHAAEDRWYCDIHWVLFYSVVVSAWNILQLILFLLDILNLPS